MSDLLGKYRGEAFWIPCPVCRGLWLATVGKPGWNRCGCGEVHDAIDLLWYIDRESMLWEARN
jgi:hypothetical protein